MASSAMTWIVGYSGGLDSTVLLHRFALSLSGPEPLNLIAVYVNHQLQSSADGWGKHCKEFCAKFNIAFVEVKLTGKPKAAESVEGWARAGRMKALADEAKKHANPIILLAHHAQDQVETFIYRALRGSGASGLASMQTNATWHGVPVQRPLINETKTSLGAYAQAQGLKWIDDPSNKDERLARNAIRAQVIPALKKVMPDATARIVNSVQSLSDDAQLLAEVGASDLAASKMSASALGLLSDVRAANALRAWIRQVGLPHPSRAVLSEMRSQLVIKTYSTGNYSHSGQVSYAGWLWTRYRDRLDASPLPQEQAVDWTLPPQAANVQWPTGAGYRSQNHVHLNPGFAAVCIIHQGDQEGAISESIGHRRSGSLLLRLPRPWLSELRVMPLGGATTFRLAANRPTRSLKAHCQSLGIASVARPWLPVIMYRETALMAAGVGVNWEAVLQVQASLASDPDTTQLELSWRDTEDCRRAFL
jgi:tRNA(Ile)-lysidine synthase